MPGLYGNVGNTTVSGGNTTSLYNTSTYVTVSNNINVNDINASGNLFVAGTGTFGGNVTAPNFNGNLVGGNISGVNLDLTGNAEIDGNLTVGGTIFGTFSGNIAGNIVVPGANTNVLFNNNGNAGSSNDFTFNDATNVMTVNGTANVGVLNATGNITGDYFFGNAAFMTGIPATYGNANVESLLASGTITSNVITAGNISGNYILGNGSQLTGLPATYSNANVTSLMANFGSNVIVTTGNITGGNFIGNGQYLTNLPGANVTGTVANATYATNAGAATSAISATTAVTVTGNAQANITSVGTLTSLAVSGNVTTGNVSGTNGTFTTVIGNGAQLSNITGANVTGTVANATYATSAGSATTATHATTANTVTDAAQGNITSLGTLTALTVGGDQNITGNLIVGQNLTVNGNTIQVNITELNVQDPIIGLGRGENNAPLTSNDGKDRGEQLWYYAGSEKSAFTGYDNSAGNLILATDVAIANEIVSVNAWGTTEVGDLYAHGNITGDYVFGNAAFMTGIPAQYGNANVADFLDSFGSNAIVTTGNVTAGYFFGDGSGLTNINAGNIVGSYGNANVANFLANYGSNTIVTTGNISGGNVIGTFLYGDGTNITGVVAGAASTRIEVKNTSGVTITKGTPVYATGTVGASTIIEIAASRADTASTMPCLGLLAQDLNNNDQGYAISVGTLTSTNTNGFTTGQELYVAAAGGLTASRPTGTNIVQTVGIVGRVNSVNGSIEVNVWNVNSLPNLGNGNVWIGNANGFPTQQVAYGDANVAAYLPTYTGNLAGGNITVTGVYYGNGSGLTAITGANVTGTVANATYATSAGSAGTATTAVTVTGNAQANITSVGTLTSLAVSGNIGTGGILTDNYYYANGTPISFGGTYGNANVSNFLANGFGSNSITTTGNITSGNIDVTGVLFNSANANVTIQDNVIVVGNLSVSNLSRVNIGTVTLVNDSGSPSSLDIQATSVDFNGLITTSQGITATGNIQGSYFIGNGSQLTGILTSPLSANLDTNNFSIVNSAGANVSIADDLNVSGNIYTGSLKSVWVGSVEMFNNSGAPAGIIIRGGVEVDGNINVKGATINQGNVFIEDAAGVLFADADNSNYIGLKGPSVTAANVTFTLPNADGGSGQVLSTYGNGVMYWQSTTSGYGNANVSNFLANGFGSNTIVTTGNIDANNFNATTSVRVSGSAGNISGANYVIANYFSGNGSQLTGINSFATIDANGTSIVADSISDTLTLVAGTNITITGNAAADSITISATGGGGTPGGANTQIQFNDGGAFAGNSNMAFNKVTGNIDLGNLRVITNNAGQNPILNNINSFVSTTRPNPGRIGVGGGYANDWTTTYDTANRWRNARLAVVDRVLGSGAGNTTFSSAVNYFETASEFYAVNDSGSRVTDSTAFGAGRFGLNLWGPSAFGNTNNTQHLVASYSALGAAVNIGNTTVGNANVVSAVASTNTIQVNAGSNANLAISTTASSTNLGTMGTWIGQGFNVTFGSTLTAPGNVWLIHNPGQQNNNLSTASYSIQDSYRAASTYYFLRNDDAVAQVRLGSLRAYHHFRNTLTASSGNITANAAGATGTVFYHNPAANANLLVTGAVVTASDSVNTDQQMTYLQIIIDQGATGYDITLPTTSGTNIFRYKAGANTVANTANSTSVVEYRVYQDAGGNTVYAGEVSTYT